MAADCSAECFPSRSHSPTRRPCGTRLSRWRRPLARQQRLHLNRARCRRRGRQQSGNGLSNGFSDALAGGAFDLQLPRRPESNLHPHRRTTASARIRRAQLARQSRRCCARARAAARTAGASDCLRRMSSRPRRSSRTPGTSRDPRAADRARVPSASRAARPRTRALRHRTRARRRCRVAAAISRRCRVRRGGQQAPVGDASVGLAATAEPDYSGGCCSGPERRKSGVIPDRTSVPVGGKSRASDQRSSGRAEHCPGPSLLSLRLRSGRLVSWRPSKADGRRHEGPETPAVRVRPATAEECLFWPLHCSCSLRSLWAPSVRVGAQRSWRVKSYVMPDQVRTLVVVYVTQPLPPAVPWSSHARRHDISVGLDDPK